MNIRVVVLGSVFVVASLGAGCGTTQPIATAKTVSLGVPSLTPSAATSPTQTQAPTLTSTPASGTFAALTASPDRRDGGTGPTAAYTATLLIDGRVLIAGGIDPANNQALATAQVFDPIADRFVPTGLLTDARTGQSATRLEDGRVLLAGGADADNGLPLSSAELYDPTTGTFATTGGMATPRENHTATLLRDGRVLVVGGDQDCFRDLCKVVDTSEIYDPATGRFNQAAKPHFGREGHTATSLPDGRVLIAGGDDNEGNSLAEAEIYDPTTGQFRLTGTMRTPRLGQTATLLANGEVLLAGGGTDAAAGPGDFPVLSGGFALQAELYDEDTGKFASTGSLTTARMFDTATLLPDGRVLIAGGAGTTAELYNAATGKFALTGSMVFARANCTATLLLNGPVLILEGDADNAPGNPATAEFYQP
jgi:hypothetical protein